MLQSSFWQLPAPVLPVLLGDDAGDVLFGFVHSPAGDSFALCCLKHILSHNFLTTCEHTADQLLSRCGFGFGSESAQQFLSGDPFVAIQPAKPLLITQSESQRLSLRSKGGLVVYDDPDGGITFQPADQQNTPGSSPEVNGPQEQSILYSYDLNTGEVGLFCKEADCLHRPGSCVAVNTVFCNLEQYGGKLYGVDFTTSRVRELVDGRFQTVIKNGKESYWRSPGAFTLGGFWHSYGELYVVTGGNALLIYEDGSSEPRWVLEDYGAYWNVVFGRHLYGNNQPDREDLVHDALLRLMKNVPVLRTLEPNALAGYLYLTVRSVWMDSRRREQPLTEDILERLASRDPEEANLAKWDVAALKEKLPERDWFLLHAKYVTGYSDAEIGGILGCAPGSVRTLLTRARKRAKAILESKEENSHET